jgi:NADH-quinone oxidoreductase subunit F
LEVTIQQLPLQGELSIQIFLGMGAYVCGEETALLESLEGKRGEPRLKPPFPGVAGLHQCPTVINNVETFACVAYILSNGADAFLAKGDSEYPGYKLYTIAGAVEHPGVYEAEAGLSVGELLQLAGGMKVGQTLAAIQVGGGSGKLLHADALDLKMTPNDCRSFGTGLGTGSVRFFSEEDDLHEYVASRTEFYASESCGCCVPCRAGLEALTELLRASELDAERILDVAEYIKDGARCALAAAAVTPVVSWLEGGFDHEN